VASMLVVDDERDIVRILGEFLGSHGHEVTAAHSGTQALSLARQHRFDLVFLDIVMPGMDGNETLRRLRTEDPSQVVVMITGLADENAVIESMTLGAFDSIRKPFDFKNLERVVALGLAMRA